MATMDLLSDFDAPDPVSEVLRAVRIRSTVYCRSVLAAPWGFGVTGHGNPAFHVVTTGTCWLEVDGGPDQVPLAAGDLVVLPTGRRHWLRDNPATPAIELEELLAGTPPDENRRLRYGGRGPGTGLLCGGFALDGGGAHPILRVLPARVLIRGVDGHPVPWLAATLTLLSAETASAAPGAEEVVSRLADALLAQALRVALVELQSSDGAGVLALRDPQMAAAIERIHRRPDHPWTVGELAAEVALSRSAFSARFRQVWASPPSGSSSAPASPPPPPCCTRPTPLWRRSPSGSGTAPSSPSPRPSSAASALPPAPTAGSHRVSPGSVATPMPPCSLTTSPLHSARGPAPHSEELPLGLGRRQGRRTLVGGRGLAVPAQPPKQIGSGGVEQVVVVQILQPLHQRQRRGRVLQLTDGDGAVEGHHRGGGDHQQLVVQGDDLRPVGLLDRRGVRVHGVDGRLELIGTRLVGAKAAAEDRLTLGDQGPVPLGAVLLAQQHQGTVGPGSRGAAGLAQQQERQQAGHLRLVRHQRRQDPRQPDRLSAEFRIG